MSIMQDNKYLLALAYTVKYQLANKGQIIGRIILYSIIVFLFSQVFTSVNGEHERIWYISMTQLISLSGAPLAFQIVKDLLNKQYEYFLIRPLDYLLFRFSEAAGISIVNYVILWCCFMVICLSVTTAHPTWNSIFIGSLYGCLSMCLYIMMTIVIGLLSFWIKDIKNVFYLNLTITFCLGGLIVPLNYYSTIIKNISFYTPYPWILWAPAQIINNNINVITAISYTLGWIMLFYGIILLLHRRALRQFVA
jgi:ABC-2 type transport system permease protein